MNKPAFNLLIVAGPDSGREFVILQDGARLGRSSNNDIALKDPAMSRFHCRFFFKPDEGLWAEDLGSANQTLLNQKPLHVAQLHPGDILTIGATDIKVVSDRMPDVMTQNLFEPETTLPPQTNNVPQSPGNYRKHHKLLALLALTLTIIVIGFIAWRELQHRQLPTVPTAQDAMADNSNLEIIYEKILASPKNVFRYVMTLREHQLSVQIDDLENKRHVAPTQRKKVDNEIIERLAEETRQMGFFEMQDFYKGMATDLWEQWDLRITIGRRTGRVRVLNTMGPETFRRVCDMLEEFARNELGLTALALTPEKLLELAQKAALLGRSLYDQRMVKNENLALAIRALKETEWYLETVDPKPEYFPDTVALLANAERELQEIYDNHMFLVERATRLKDWQEAAAQLRTVCERIPERNDARHTNARRRLIEVESNIKRK